MNIETQEAVEIEADSVAVLDDDDSFPAELNAETFPAAANEIRTVEQLNTFIEQHFDGIRRVIRSQCFATPERVEDVAQELYPRLVTFLLDSSEGIHKPWAFIRTTARRLAIDEMRRARTLSRRFVPLYDDTFLSETQDKEVIESEEHESDFRFVHEAIQSLQEKERAVISRIFLDGRRGRDVAREMHLSESYVAEIKAAALSRLRELLAGDMSKGRESIVANG